MSDLFNVLPQPPTPPEEPPFPSRVAVWVSAVLNALVVAGMGVAFANAHQSHNEAAMAACVAGAIALVGVSNWLLFSVNWHKAVERAKWDAFRDYDARIVAVNETIEQVNRKIIEVDARETDSLSAIESQRVESDRLAAVAEKRATGIGQCLAVANQRLIKASLTPVMINAANNLPDYSSNLTDEEKKLIGL